jgi:hypothetical protein
MDKIEFNVNGVIVEMEKEEVSKAIEAGKVEIKSESLIAYEKEKFDEFKTNLADDEYKKGKTAGSEMLIKEAREKYELDFEGKTIENFADAFKTKIEKDSKIEPSKKIQELEADKAKLQGNLNTLQGEFETFKTTITEKETRSKKDNAILSQLPDNLIVDKDIALLTLKQKAGLDIDFNEDGKKVITVNGAIQKDETTLSPIEISKDYLTDKLKSLGLVKQKEGGSGGGDEPGGGAAGSYDKFVKEMAANGKAEGSEEFNIEMNKRIANKTLTF